MNKGLAEEERSRTAEVVREVISSNTVTTPGGSLSTFDWNSVDIGNTVVD